jgi:hypothetical protein
MKPSTSSMKTAVFQERGADPGGVCVDLTRQDVRRCQPRWTQVAFSIVRNPSTYSRDAMSDKHHGPRMITDPDMNDSR